LYLNALRVVLAATNHLYEHIAILRNRIRLLESALDAMHVERTGKTHPLLERRPEDNWDHDDDYGGGGDDDDDLETDIISKLDGLEISDDNGTLASDPDGAPRIFGSVDRALIHSASVHL
jgi:hypothetical protein